MEIIKRLLIKTFGGNDEDVNVLNMDYFIKKFPSIFSGYSESDLAISVSRKFYFKMKSDLDELRFVLNKLGYEYVDSVFGVLNLDDDEMYKFFFFIIRKRIDNEEG